MIKDLIRLANRLDEKGLQKEADMVDKMILRLAEEKEPIGASGMEALCNILSSYYYHESVGCREVETIDNKTTWKVIRCKQKHIDHLKKQSEKIKEYGKEFTKKIIGEEMFLEYKAIEKEGEGLKTFKIKIPLKIEDEENVFFEVSKENPRIK